MNITQKKKQVYDSIDKLSQEMAQFIINNNKTKIIAEIEEDIIKNEKFKRGKEQNSDKIIFFSSDSSDRQQINLSQKDNISFNSLNSKYTNKSNKSKENDIKLGNNSSKINPISLKEASNKKLKKVCFAIDEKKKKNEEINKLNLSKENINVDENNNKKEDENKIKNNNNIEKNEGNKIIIKNNKEDLEITFSPIYGYRDEDEINYYNIKSYIDKNKKKFEKKLLFDKDKTYTINATATFGDSKDKNSKLTKNNNNIFINKNKINALLKDNKDNNNNLILKSYTQKTINSLKKKPNEINKNTSPERRKKMNTIKEKGIFIENQKKKSNDNSNNSDEYIKYIDTISQQIQEVEEENKISKESSYSNNNSKSYNLSSNTGNSSYDFHITTTSYNSNNLIIDYTKSGRNSKYKNFLEKQLKRQRLTDSKIKKMKRNKELKEYQNYYSSPKINSLSLEIVKNKGNYVPLFKRAVEIENEKKMKRLIYQKMQNNNFIVNNSNYGKRTKKQINDFFYAQMDWKDKIDKKTNNLRQKLNDKSLEQISEYLNYEIKINPKSELIISKKRKKNSLSITDISQTNSEIIYNSANRLYKDYEKRQKKLKRLKKELTPSFRPSINKSPPLYNYKTSRNNYRVNVNQKIDEVRMDDNNDNSYRFKYQSNSQTIIRNNSGISIKTQKSRNSKNISKNQISSRYFNKKENNLKSTAVDSRNTKSALKISNDINNTKLEKINENNISNEENSNNNNNTNKNSDKNKNNKNIIDSSLFALHNNSKKTKTEKENQKSQNNSKNNNSKNNDKKDHNKSHISKKNKSNNNNSNNISKESKSSQSNTNTSNSKIENNKTNSSNNESKNSIEDSPMKNSKINKIINKSQNKEENDNNDKKKANKNVDNEYIKTIGSRASKQNEKKENNNNVIRKFKRNNSCSNISPNINIKNQIKKSIKNIKINKNIFMKNSNKPPFNRHKSVITKKSSEFLFRNNYKDKDKLSPKLVNSIQNQNDTIEINNFENNNINDFNDFLTNNTKSKANSKAGIIKNSSFENEILISKKDSFFDENFKSEKSSEKKNKKKIIKKYKFNNSLEDEENEEDEEIEESNEINSKQNKSISWIKKLEEISKNEENKTEREKDELNKKKKLGASTTRSQTNRKNSDKEKDINININKKIENIGQDKLYLLNSRNNSSTGNLNPYTFTAKNEIFYKFFLKKK